ncbi:MAG: hypothetical protein GY772_17515 [bacterium]|nr:hypothetical protein [bacterium]
MGGSQRLSVPLRLVSEANAREHWRGRHRRRRAQRGQLALVASASFSRPALPCKISMTRVAPRALDSDNLVSSFKASRDGICDWLGVDDRSDQITWAYAQRKGAVREYALEVEIIESSRELTQAP